MPKANAGIGPNLVGNKVGKRTPTVSNISPIRSLSFL